MVSEEFENRLGGLLDTQQGYVEQLEGLALQRRGFGGERNGRVRRLRGGDEVQRHSGEVIDQATETVDWHAVIAAAGATLALGGVGDLG